MMAGKVSPEPEVGQEAPRAAKRNAANIANRLREGTQHGLRSLKEQAEETANSWLLTLEQTKISTVIFIVVLGLFTMGVCGVMLWVGINHSLRDFVIIGAGGLVIGFGMLLLAAFLVLKDAYVRRKKAEGYATLESVSRLGADDDRTVTDVKTVKPRHEEPTPAPVSILQKKKSPDYSPPEETESANGGSLPSREMTVIDLDELYKEKKAQHVVDAPVVACPQTAPGPTDTKQDGGEPSSSAVYTVPLCVASPDHGAKEYGSREATKGKRRLTSAASEDSAMTCVGSCTSTVHPSELDILDTSSTL